MTPEPPLVQKVESTDGDSRSATERTIDGIVELIGAGRLMPSSRLPPESDLASMMGVSRGSLREAVRVLAYLGIVDVRVGNGTYVTDLDGANLLRGLGLVGQVANENTVLEIFEIRRILESAAAAMAATRITDNQIQELENLVEQMRVESEGESFVKLDIQFHDLIAAATGNDSLRMLCGSFSARTQRVRLVRSRNVEGILARSNIEHEGISRHIKCGEPILAAAAATSHVANVEHWLRQDFEAVRRSTDHKPATEMPSGTGTHDE